MISRVEALRYRCLRSVDRSLRSFHVLVGPNASGKTTFLDVIGLLGDIVSVGLGPAIEARSANFLDLTWNGQGDRIELAVEATIPSALRSRLYEPGVDTVRYEIVLALDGERDEVVIQAERVRLRRAAREAVQTRLQFPDTQVEPASVLQPRSIHGSRVVVNKVQGGNDNFYSEVHREGGKGWAPSFRLGTRKSALGNLPDDEENFPVSTWLRRLLTEGVQSFVLDSQRLRRASPPNRGRGFQTDGSNLPWVVDRLRKTPEVFDRWLAHVRTALRDVVSVHTVERPDDKHRYLVIEYEGGTRVPSWVASDGTLRLLALTLPAYLQDFQGVYLVEEPENGIHPRAVETVFQALSQVADAQVLLATHSPVVLSMADTAQVLCFAKDGAGATDIARGDEHPSLVDWKGSDLSALYVAGVLG